MQEVNIMLYILRLEILMEIRNKLTMRMLGMSAVTIEGCVVIISIDEIFCIIEIRISMMDGDSSAFLNTSTHDVMIKTPDKKIKKN